MVEIRDNSLQSCKNRIAIIKGILAKINFKDCASIVHILVKINLHHVDLVQISVQGQTIIWKHVSPFIKLHRLFLLYHKLDKKRFLEIYTIYQ